MPRYGLAVPLGLAFADGIARGVVAAARELPSVQIQVLQEPLSAAAIEAWAATAAMDGVISWLPLACAQAQISVCTGRAPGVTVDEAAVGRLAATYLQSLAPASLVVLDTAALWSQARAAAFVSAATRARCLMAADWQTAAGAQRLARQLARLPQPVAVFAGNDRTAVALAAACEVARLHIGNEILLLGADDDPLSCASARVPLSSIVIDWQQLGRAALLHLHEHRTGLLVQQPVMVQERASTGHHTADTDHQRLRRLAASGVTDVPAFAAAAGVSRRRLERYCQRYFACSPLALLHQERCRRAQALLHDGLPVAEVVRHCGWQSRAAFVRAFYRQVGMTPSVWRQQHET